ncbi:uncharacterized protein LOC130956869 [Arachis stenosperma]|uniref:uncharacterized protein LOC130956869 n=1 Tax=Arachis stenosperma TaxID=217475 RepID=UPI0025AC9D53|nr:uncharacterized protein LOC130956869 [Arachis stenosperma]
MGATPFHPYILKVCLPKNFDKPTNMKYDGTKDPQEHLTTFEVRMNLEGVGDAVRCSAFPLTLVGPAIRWFNVLPQGYITTFADITKGFFVHFTTRIFKAKYSINLLEVTQQSSEPMRKFLDRFNDKCLEIDGLTDSVEIQNAAREYINEEEVSQVVAANKQQPYNQLTRQASYPEKPTEAPKEGTSEKPFKPFPWVDKFTKYTPSRHPSLRSTSRSWVRYTGQAKVAQGPNGGNKSLYCDYHKGFGHKMQDCFDLKNALEQAIQEGKLAEFSQLSKNQREGKENDLRKIRAKL